MVDEVGWEPWGLKLKFQQTLGVFFHMSKPWWIELSSTLVGGGEYPVELAKCVQASVDTIVIKKKKTKKEKRVVASY